MSRRTPIGVIRAQMRADASDALGAVLRDEGVQQVEIAAATSAPAQYVQRWTDPNHASTITLADAVLIGRSYPGVARRLLSWAAGLLGLRVVAEREASDPRDALGLLSAATDAAHGMQRALLDAVSPGGDGGEVITDGELEAIVAAASSLEGVAAEVLLSARTELAARRGARDGRVS